MENKNSDPIAGEVENRLEDLFGEHGENPRIKNNSTDSKDHPIKELKGYILSIDWEISDEILNALIGEIAILEQTYQDDKDLVLFLQLLGSVGKYIKKRKVNAHPGAIKLLNSVFNSMEQVILAKDITEEEKRQTLLVQVEEFKKLKEQIALKKTETETKPAAIPQEELKQSEEVADKPSVDLSRMTPQEALSHILTEVKHVIREEFKALREELKRSHGS